MSLAPGTGCAACFPFISALGSAPILCLKQGWDSRAEEEPGKK